MECSIPPARSIYSLTVMLPGGINDLESPQRQTPAESRRHSVAVVHRDLPRRVAGFLLFAVLSVLLFLKPFIGLVRHALADEVSSYILLVPFISGYLVWSKRHELSPKMGISQ